MIYEQATGKIKTELGSIFGIGYSGNGDGKNNPLMESVKNVGVIPKGKYTIGKPYNSEHTGVFTMHLEPFKENIMYGRSEFKIHGDNISNPGTASEGCIIFSRRVREMINNCTDKTLEVI